MEGDDLTACESLDALEVEFDALGLVADIGNLDIDLARRLVEHGRSRKSVLVAITCHYLIVHSEWEYVSAFVVSVEILNPVRIGSMLPRYMQK